MCKFLVETSIVSVCKKLFHLTYCKTFYKLTFIAHCVEKQNRHYFCDRAAWGWMTAKQNQDSFKTCLETTKFIRILSYLWLHARYYIPRASRVCALDAVNSQFVRHIFQRLNRFLVWSMVVCHFAKIWTQLTSRKGKKFVPHRSSARKWMNFRACLVLVHFFHVICDRDRFVLYMEG